MTSQRAPRETWPEKSPKELLNWKQLQPPSTRLKVLSIPPMRLGKVPFKRRESNREDRLPTDSMMPKTGFSNSKTNSPEPRETVSLTESLNSRVNWKVQDTNSKAPTVKWKRSMLLKPLTLKPLPSKLNKKEECMSKNRDTLKPKLLLKRSNGWSLTLMILRKKSNSCSSSTEEISLKKRRLLTLKPSQSSEKPLSLCKIKLLPHKLH